MWTTIIVSLACDICIIGALLCLHRQDVTKVEDVERNTAVQIEKAINE